MSAMACIGKQPSPIGISHYPAGGAIKTNGQVKTRSLSLEKAGVKGFQMNPGLLNHPDQWGHEP